MPERVALADALVFGALAAAFAFLAGAFVVWVVFGVILLIRW